MKILGTFLLLLCLPLFAFGPDESHVQGAWLQSSVKWTKAPSDINPHLETSQVEILYLGQDHTFGIIYCTVYRVRKEYQTISNGDARGVYLGKWQAAGDQIGVEYRLVDRTVKIEGEKLPGPIQHATIKVSRGVLRLERNTFHRAEGLDKSAVEVLNGVPSAQ